MSSVVRQTLDTRGPETLVDVLHARSGSDRGVIFVEAVGRSRTVSYRELYREATARLQHWQQAGLHQRGEVVLLLNDNHDFLVSFWAALLGGLTPVPVAPGNSDEHRLKLFRILDTLERGWLYTDAPTLERLREFAGDNTVGAAAVLADRTLISEAGAVRESGIPETMARGASTDVLPVPSVPVQDDTVAAHSASLDDTAFIQFSSGSTSTPKGVVLTHRNLMTNLRAIVERMQMGADDRQLSWMPLTHDMGLIGFHLVSVLCDLDHVLIPTALFVRRASVWLDAASEHDATILCSPNFGYEHCLKSVAPDGTGDPALNLARVRLIFNGAEPISPELCDRFLDTFASAGLKRDAMFTVYGLAEASLAVTFPPLGREFRRVDLPRSALAIGASAIPVSRDAEGSVALVSVGVPVNDVELRVVGADGTALMDGHTGHVHIRGASVTSGYYREPALNAEAISTDGWLDTGDLGVIIDGELVISGRAKDVLFVNGQNLYPHDLEEIVIREALVERGKIAIAGARHPGASEEQVVAFVQFRGSDEGLADLGARLQRLLNEQVSISVDHVVAVQRLPKTTSGKVQRFRLSNGFMTGEFDRQWTRGEASDAGSGMASSQAGEPGVPGEAAIDSSASISDQLLAICQRRATEVSVQASDNLFDLGISSLTLAGIHADIEDQWPGEVDITDLFDYPTVAELATFLEERASCDARV